MTSTLLQGQPCDGQMKEGKRLSRKALGEKVADHEKRSIFLTAL